MSSHPAPVLSRPLALLLAAACAVAVSTIYLSQPLVGLIAPAVGLDPGAASLVVTVAQLGYAAGILLLVPLGDVVENRRLILGTMCASVASLGVTALANTAATLLGASFALGLTAVSVQMLIPYASHLARPEERGRVVGAMVAGLSTGILLARPFASLVADLAGWRLAFAVAAAILAGVALLLARLLPRRRPEAGGSWGEAVRSMGPLLVREPVLRRRAIYQASLFGAFSLFWTTVPLHLADAPFGFGQRAIAGFALVGAIGIAASPLAGWLADRGFGRATTAFALLLVAGAFALAWVGRDSVMWLAVSAITLDAGVQLGLVVGQRAIFGLAPAMRSRLNAVLIACFFLSGAIGSALASPILHAAGWAGVTALGTLFPLVGFLFFLVLEPRRQASARLADRGDAP